MKAKQRVEELNGFNEREEFNETLHSYLSAIQRGLGKHVSPDMKIDNILGEIHLEAVVILIPIL